MLKTGPFPQVTLTDDYAEIANIRITDPDTLSYLRQVDPGDLVSEIVKAINLGVAVTSRVQASSDMEFVNRRLSEMTAHVDSRFMALNSNLQSALQTHLDPGAADSFMAKTQQIIANQSQQIGKELGDLLRETRSSIAQETSRIEEGRKQLDQSLNPKYADSYLAVLIEKFGGFENYLNTQLSETDASSFIGKLRSAVGDYFGDNGQVLQLIDDKLRVDIEGKTPLGQVFLGLRTEIQDLRDLLVKLSGQKELMEQTSVKGFVFEDRVFERLQDISQPHSDLVEDLSKQAEVSGSKKGDYLYSVQDSPGKIVLDAKCYKRITSLPGMLSYIKQAMSNRDAAFGIIVVPEKRNLQKQIGEWNVYGDIIITPLEHLETSIKYAKNCLRLKEFKSNEVNVGLIKYKLDEVRRKIKGFSSIKGKLTKLNNGVSTSIAEVQMDLSNLKEEIAKKLEEIGSEI
jgi:hypothetical protein